MVNSLNSNETQWRCSWLRQFQQINRVIPDLIRDPLLYYLDTGSGAGMTGNHYLLFNTSDDLEITFALTAKGSKITCVVPSRYCVFSAFRILPYCVSDKRLRETAGLAI